MDWVFAEPSPALSNAVPWSTEVRTIGSPRVRLTDDPCHLPPGARSGIVVEAQELGWDMPLVMIHGHDRIVLTSAELREEGVRRKRSLRRNAGVTRGRHSRGYLPLVRGAKQAALAAVGIQSRDGNTGSGDVQALQSLVGQLDDLRHAGGLHSVADPDLELQATEAYHIAHDFRVAYQKKFAIIVDSRRDQCLGTDLRADTARVTHADFEQWLVFLTHDPALAHNRS